MNTCIIEVPFSVTYVNWFCNRSDGNRGDTFYSFCLTFYYKSSYQSWKRSLHVRQMKGVGLTDEDVIHAEIIKKLCYACKLIITVQSQYNSPISKYTIIPK